MTPALRLLLLPVILLALTQHVYSQKKKEELFYVYDENWQGTAIEHAKYMDHVYKINDTCWQADTYNLWGPLIRTGQYKEKDASTSHGRFVFYSQKGHIDSILNFQNNLAQGSWYYFNDTGMLILKKDFNQGRLVKTVDYLAPDKKDSLTPPKTEGIESEFPGGIGQWSRYLVKNMKYPARAIGAEKQGTVVIQFIVDTEGNVFDAMIYRSVEYSMDEEALRLIQGSPKWKPAEQDGRKVKSYKRQPIVFRLQ